MKEVIFAGDARTKLLEGVNLVAKAVSATLGPKGRNAVISRDTAPPIITNDGVTIAASFNKVKDPYINTGVQMIKEVATRQNEPGDGTTTATILAAYLVNEGVKHILAGVDPIEIKNGIESASKETIQGLKDSAKPIKTKEELIQVATIAVENSEAGKLIGEMMDEVGKDGAITVETSKDIKLEKDIAPGIKFEQGFMTPYFMTNPYRQEAVYEEIPILVTDHTISINEELAPLADGLLEKGIKGLVIICDDMKNEALTTTVKNTIQGIFNFLVIRLPGLDEQRAKNGEDIATAVGAKFISKEIDKLLEIKLENLGEAERVISKFDSTVIVKGGGTQKDIDNRIKVLKEEQKTAISDYDRDQLKERIARLSGGIGVLRIGAATQQELIYKKHKIEDALAATRAATEEGIVAGGGVALLRLSYPQTDNIGKKILYDAIREPIKQIASNAGKNAETII
ncbi:chaperonin GroEL, partial [Candidatus Berkelbacteria bacterium]|nr:chaperonin GroEL [Candidatus Berkelbacteria bacterium]